jgi:guanylate kinase
MRPKVPPYDTFEPVHGGEHRPWLQMNETPDTLSAKDAGGPGRLYVITAPSGAGKTSLVKALMQREPRLRFSVSFTTRKPRANEIDGRDYHFVTHAVFEGMAARGEFLEHAQVYDNAYGTSLQSVEQAMRSGELVLLEIDWQGARQVRSRLPQAHSIFILPPTRAALEARLRARSTDSDAVIARRLKDAARDIAHWNEFDYVVINDRFETAVEELFAIVRERGAALKAARPEVLSLIKELLAHPS